MAHFTRLAAIAALACLLLASVAQAVITKLTPLAEVLESDQYIFVAKADKLDPDNKDVPSAIFKVEKKLKGEPPFDRIPMNMIGDDEGKKAGDTKTIFDRLDTSRQLVFFIRKQGKIFNAKVFVEGSWFSAYGTLDNDGKTVRWAFLHGEPFLRRTFKGTSAEMITTVEDSLAKKGKPPEPDEKAKEGYGPVVEKKKGDVKPPGLLGVIPSFVLVGPLAIIAALFPGVFARLAVGMKRWRAFLVVASINSTLALIYWVLITYRPNWLPGGWSFGPRAVTAYLTLIAGVGFLWAGRRYRKLAAEEPAVTGTPGKTELYTLVGLTAFAAICTVLTAVFADWGSTLEIPIREFTFIGIALLTATTYACYRVLSKAADALPEGAEPPTRLSLSGESVALGVLVLCGLVTVLNTGPATVQTAAKAEAGEAEADFSPRLVGDPVAIEVHDIEDGKKVPEFGRVWSGMVLDGDRLYFGVDSGGNRGRVLGVNRTSGRIEFSIDAPGMLKVYCTPTVADGRVYCGEGEHEDKNCRLFCAKVSDMSEVFKPIKTTSHTEGQPAVAGGRLYFPAGDDGLYCCDAVTGAKIEQFPGGKEKGIHIDAAPAVANGTVYVGSGLYTYVAVALDAKTLKEKWRTDLKLRAFGAPTVSGKLVFYGVGTGNMGADVYPDYKKDEGEVRDKEAAGALVCLDAATGKEQWRYDLPKSVHTGVAVDAFSAYVGCRDGTVYCVDRKTGKLRWKVGMGGAILSCPTVAATGGYPVAVYAVSQEGLVVCLNPQTGAVAWQKFLPGFRWDGKADGGIMCSPVVLTTPTATGSTRTIYIGAMTVDPQNPIKKTVAVFKFEDVIGE